MMMFIYTTVVSAVLFMTIAVNCMLIHGIKQMVKENEFLEEQLKVEGEEW